MCPINSLNDTRHHMDAEVEAIQYFLAITSFYAILSIAKVIDKFTFRIIQCVVSEIAKWTTLYDGLACNFAILWFAKVVNKIAVVFSQSIVTVITERLPARDIIKCFVAVLGIAKIPDQTAIGQIAKCVV